MRATPARSIHTRILGGVNWPAVFIIALFAVAFYGSVFLRGWLFKRYHAGKISGRRAGWIYAAVGGPYLALAAYLVIRSPGTIWLALLFGFIIFGVQIVPMVALFRYPRTSAASGSRKEGRLGAARACTNPPLAPGQRQLVDLEGRLPG